MEKRILIIPLIFFVTITNICAQKSDEGSKYEYLFPKALPGWTATKIYYYEREDELFGDLTIRLTKTYRQNNDNTKITINIDTGEEMLRLVYLNYKLEKMLKDPAKKEYDSIQYKSYQGFKVYDENKNLKEILIGIAGGYIRLELNPAGNINFLNDYLNSADLEKIKTFIEDSY